MRRGKEERNPKEVFWFVQQNNRLMALLSKKKNKCPNQQHGMASPVCLLERENPTLNQIYVLMGSHNSYAY